MPFWAPVALAVFCLAAREATADDRLIGWKGETYNVESVWDPLVREVPDDIPLPGTLGGRGVEH